ncbi:MAG: hypothetical protein IPO51_00485 [Dehalococcoidia bacterium]|nr:hypothetical protein [Dehalococcoidia bacterium]
MAARKAATATPSTLERWARFTHRRRGTILGLWVVAVAVLMFGMRQYGGEFTGDFSLPGSESQRALDLLEGRFPARAGAEADLLFKDARGMNAPEAKAVADQVISELAANELIAEVESPMRIRHSSPATGLSPGRSSVSTAARTTSTARPPKKS